MKSLRRTLLRLRGAMLARRRERELAEELESHIQMQTEDNIRSGMPPAEARRAALVKFGGIESVKESYREQRGLPLLQSIVSDLHYALRGFRANPGFTLSAVAALALGIGASTAIFSVVNTVLLNPMHVSDSDNLVIVGTNYGGENGSTLASPMKFAHWRKQADVLSDVSAFTSGLVNYTGGDVVERWSSARVTADLFRCLGIPVLLGHTFTQEEDSPNGPRVAVIAEGLWDRRFARSPEILGTPVRLNGEPYTVIGVVEDSEALRDFNFDFPQVYVPLQLNQTAPDEGHFFNVTARLKPGVTLEQARERLKASTVEYRAQSPGAIGPDDFFDAERVRELLVSDYRSLFAILFTAVVLVLLIACANVANLLLARAGGRRREFAIRAAIGASRRRLMRQMLTESLLLSLVAGVLGSFLGFRGMRALLAVNTAGLPLVRDDGAGVTMDWHVMVFALAVSLAAALLFGLVPAIQGSRGDLNAVLKNSGPQSGGGAGQNRLRAVLVVSEVGLAVVLLVGAALLIRNFLHLYTVDRGFEAANVLTLDTLFTEQKFKNAVVVGEAVDAALDHLRAVPGVATAGATGCMPLRCGLFLGFDIVGLAPPPAAEQSAGWSTVSSGFFETLRVPVTRGRAFSPADTAASVPVAIINEAMAKAYWTGRDPLRDQIVIGGITGKDFKEPARQIVGIVSDLREDPSNTPRPIMYVPVAQVGADEYLWGNSELTWVIRTQGERRGFAQTIREETRRATGLPAGDVRSLDDLVSRTISYPRLVMLLMTILGCSALVLASIGIYGVIGYTVEQRRQEIGIRIALGAPVRQARMMIIRQGMGLALVGIVLGLGVAWGLAQSLQSLLFGIQARDPIVFFAVPLILGVVALTAVWIPAARVTRINPADSLRWE